ncbi:hypothetical protein KAI87_15090, partial [Myxococcota bacterium]|nr:hypothetical protein [Myxococcota bacterium]
MNNSKQNTPQVPVENTDEKTVVDSQDESDWDDDDQEDDREDYREEYEQESQDESRMPIHDPRKALPGEDPPERRKMFVLAGAAVFFMVIGAALGQLMAPEAPEQLEARVAELETTLQTERAQSRAKIGELERTIAYNKTQKTKQPKGILSKKDRRRHQRYGHQYAKALRKAQAQSAGDLMDWFIPRWNNLLDQPEPDDRIRRRAELLALLIGGMGHNLNPGDYIPWQAEFLNQKWLGELHFDMDGDGLPGKRKDKSPKDSFSNVSVCHIAMALNQSVRDAQVLVMPELECDVADAKMSVFFQGRTFDDALDEFAKAAREYGFIVKEHKQKKIR